MGIKFTNNAEGTLTAGVAGGDTTNMTLTAGDGALFPTIVGLSGDYFYATLVDVSGNREIVKVTEHQNGTDVFQVYVRAQDDTSAIAFAIGDKVQIRFPKIVLEEFRDDISTNASDLAAYEVSNDAAVAALELYNTNSAVLAAPTGLTMYIYNPAGEIPTGWSAKSGPADCLLAIAGGANAYNVAGENLAGSWTPTGHVHTIAHLHTITHTHDIQHTHEGGDHTLLTAEMPAHTHSYNNNLATGIYAGNEGSASGLPGVGTTARTSGSTGGGSAHSHGTTVSQSTNDSGASSAANTGAVDTADSGSSNDPITDRPYAAVGLLIERD